MDSEANKLRREGGVVAADCVCGTLSHCARVGSFALLCGTAKPQPVIAPGTCQVLGQVQGRDCGVVSAALGRRGMDIDAIAATAFGLIQGFVGMGDQSLERVPRNLGTRNAKASGNSHQAVFMLHP